MAAENIEERLVSYLADAHSLEQNALAQLRTGAKTTGDGSLKRVFAEHLVETEEHERLISQLLESYGERSSTFKDLAQKVCLTRSPNTTSIRSRPPRRSGELSERYSPCSAAGASGRRARRTGPAGSAWPGQGMEATLCLTHSRRSRSIDSA